MSVAIDIDIANTRRGSDEINDLIDWCYSDEGESRYPGMTYEEGIRAAIDWLAGYSEEGPHEE